MIKRMKICVSLRVDENFLYSELFKYSALHIVHEDPDKVKEQLSGSEKDSTVEIKQNEAYEFSNFPTVTPNIAYEPLKLQ